MNAWRSYLFTFPVTVVLGLSNVPLEAYGAEGPYRWGMHPMEWMWGAWGIGMMLIMLIFWGLVITGLIFGIRWLLGQTKPSRSDSALEILRERYARGEINKDEFEARKGDLLS